MPEYVLAYHGGSRPSTQEEGAKFQQKWMAWIKSIGDAAVNPAIPLGMSKTVGADGVTDDGGSNPLSGLTIVKADNMDAAIEMAKGCPHLDIGGTLEVAEVMKMG